MQVGQHALLQVALQLLLVDVVLAAGAAPEEQVRRAQGGACGDKTRGCIGVVTGTARAAASALCIESPKQGEVAGLKTRLKGDGCKAFE